MPKTVTAKARKAPKVPALGFAELSAMLKALQVEQQAILRAVTAGKSQGPTLAAIQQAVGALDLSPGQLEAVLTILRTHLPSA